MGLYKNQAIEHNTVWRKSRSNENATKKSRKNQKKKSNKPLLVWSMKEYM